MWLTRIWIIPVVVFCSLTANAQEADTLQRHFIQINAQYGFIIEQEGFYQVVAGAHVQGFSAEFGFLSRGHAIWERQHKFPEFGLGFHWADMNNPDVLGYGYSGYGFARFPLGRRRRTPVQLNTQIGLSYLSRKFDTRSNYWNLAIGSHINAYLNLSVDSYLKLHPQLWLKYGFGLTHFSNGSFETPNLGLNLVMLRTGLRFNAYRQAPDYTGMADTTDYGLQHDLILRLWGGLREEYPVDKPKYESVVLQLSYGLLKRPQMRWNAGIDLMYESHIIRKYERIKYPAKANAGDVFRIGLLASGDIVFGDVRLFLQAGAYLRNKLHSPTKILYERVGLDYHFSENWMATIALKVHYVEADYISVGVGYRWAIK